MPRLSTLREEGRSVQTCTFFYKTTTTNLTNLCDPQRALYHLNATLSSFLPALQPEILTSLHSLSHLSTGPRNLSSSPYTLTRMTINDASLKTGSARVGQTHLQKEVEVSAVENPDATLPKPTVSAGSGDDRGSGRGDGDDDGRGGRPIVSRSYQLEMFEQSKNRNVIVVVRGESSSHLKICMLIDLPDQMDTGTGKTLV